VVSRSSRGLTGEWQNPTGLVFLRARFYSPELGIFLSRDPFQGFLTKPASLTPYQYAFNNPVRYTDPSGENPLLLVGLLGGLLGGAIYGYGSQVVRNYNSGDFNNCPWWAIFTTNISAGQIALYAGAGALLGLGIGGAMVGIQALAGYLGIGPAFMPLYQWISRFFTRNPNAQTVSLGSFDPLKLNGYIEVGETNGYTYFQMNPLLYRVLNAIGQAIPINQGFMLNQINQSKDFIITNLALPTETERLWKCRR
jgi:RHS repeat-associated protein